MSEVDALLDAADAVLDDPTRASAAWLRAAGLLYRGALEDALTSYWKHHERGVATTNRRVQLLCLTGYLDAPDDARQVAHVWAALSEVTHHRTALGPHRSDVVRLGEQARRLVAMLENACR